MIMSDKEPKQQKPAIEYPYMPEQGTVVYETMENPVMQMAKGFARRNSLDKSMPNTSVIVKGGEVIGIGANGSNFHEEHGCERVRQGIPTGQGYELCEGCHPKNHGEQTALADVRNHQGDVDLTDAEVYLWGHWWCCESCWEAMLDNGITTVHLLEASEVLFNRDDPNNIIGSQFEN